MTLQIAVNMATAFIVFVGGLMIVFLYPERLAGPYRMLIVLFVTFYFAARMGQSILAIKRERRRREGGTRDLTDRRDDEL
jgi:hypothetical protein